MKKKSFLLFLIAAFSLTQIRIVGWIGISELCLLLAGPFLLWNHMKALRRDGFGPFLLLAFLWCVGAIVTDLYRGTVIKDALRGLASPMTVLLITPGLYLLLRDDPRRVKWAVLGFVATRILSTWVLPAGTSYSMAESMGTTAAEAAEEYKLTYVAIVSAAVAAVCVFGYTNHRLVAMVAMLAYAVFGLWQGGRSSFLCALISAGLLFLGMGVRGRVADVRRLFPVMVVASILLTVAAKYGYEYAAVHGFMGEAEYAKYEAQKASKIGLLSGRSEFIASLFAIKDSPLIGHGSWARDYNGYALRTLEWLGEDDAFVKHLQYYDLLYIPAHSHIHGAYVWHGVLGYLFWVYTLYIIYKICRAGFGRSPELFAYLAVMVPLSLWNILFSPFGDRVGTTLFLVICLLLLRKRQSISMPVHNMSEQILPIGTGATFVVSYWDSRQF